MNKLREQPTQGTKRFTLADWILAALGVVLLVWLGTMTLVSCAVDETNVTPTQSARLAEIRAHQAAAAAAGDKAAQDAADAELTAFEDQVLRERAGPIAGTLAAINPALGWLSPLIVGFAPLAGKRGRRNAAKGLKAASKGQIVEAALAIPRTLGILDSTKDSGAVARGEKVAVHPDDVPSGAAVG